MVPAQNIRTFLRPRHAVSREPQLHVEISQFVWALVLTNPNNGMEMEIPSVVGFDESNNVWHSICICHARSDVLKQVHLPFLKGHAAACTPTIQSSCISTKYQLESPGTELVTDHFFPCCNAGACRLSGSQSLLSNYRSRSQTHVRLELSMPFLSLK